MVVAGPSPASTYASVLARRKIRLLRQIPHRRPRLQRNRVPPSNAISPEAIFSKRRFARPVAPHQANPLPRPHANPGAIQQRHGAKGHANIVSDFIKYPRGHAAMRIREVGLTEVCTSIIVAAELRFGAVKKQSLQLMGRIEEALDAIQVLPFAAPADAEYAKLRAILERRAASRSAATTFLSPRTPWRLAAALSPATRGNSPASRVLAFENWLR
jgi:tRNA(fMet)-specific endonuclease VapC